MLTFVGMSAKTKIILSVSNDLNSDQRLEKVCMTLIQQGYEIELLGRYLKDKSMPIDRPYACRRFHLWFNRGPLFYLNLNLRLFWHLLFARFQILIANDLDTLPANYLISILRGKTLVYDSHEYFTEVPELIDRPKVKKIWEKIENWILPNIEHAYTVSPSIAEAYQQKYGLKMGLVRNFPSKDESQEIAQKQQAVIYQGALNMGRGLEELIHAFKRSELSEVKLWIFGTGDLEHKLINLSKSLGLSEKIIFFGRKQPAALKSYTQRAALGVSLEHAMGFSYQSAIPNKIFDYLHAGTPVLYAPLKEIERLLDGKEVGEKLRSHDPNEIAKQISRMMSSVHILEWQSNARVLANEYCWQNEERQLIQIIRHAHSE